MKIDRAKLWNALIETPGTIKEFAKAAGFYAPRWIYNMVLTGYCKRKKFEALAKVLGVQAEEFILSESRSTSKWLNVNRLEELIRQKFKTKKAFFAAIKLTDTGYKRIVELRRCSERTLRKMALALNVKEGDLLDEG
ncbi:MAG: hypothetical protein SR1Q5_03295 [Quinella sp. 1Q5]|nr:hypothetical protein [Quinella sp. 1Q5]